MTLEYVFCGLFCMLIFMFCNTCVTSIWCESMTEKKNSVVSAQVIMHPREGKSIDDIPGITANTLAEYAPSENTVKSTVDMFLSKGFEVGYFVGISFSVTGTVEDFQKLFGKQIHLEEDHSYVFVDKNGTTKRELSKDELPVEIRDLVYAIVFPQPPDFGPSNFSF